MARPDRLARALVDASLELHRRRTWTRVPADAPILVRVPDEEEPLAVCLIGQDGDELGLVAVPGADALGHLWRELIVEERVEVGSDRCGFLSLTFERLGAVPDALRGPLRAAGFQARRESIAPFFFSKPAHRVPRAPNRRETRMLAWCLAGILAAEDRGELLPRTPLRGRKILELEVSGSLREPVVGTRLVPWSPGEPARRAAPSPLPPELGALPRTDERWIAGLVPLPGGIEGDQRTFCTLLVLDEESEKMLGGQVVASEETAEAVSALIELLREHGLPRELVFTSQSLLEAVAPRLESLGVACALDVDDPAWWEVAEELSEAVCGEAEAGVWPRTLEEWKRADARFTRRLVEDVMSRGLLTPRAVKRYFGSEEAAGKAILELERYGAMQAFIEWFAADYRPTRRSRTYVEKRLEKKRLDPLERELLEARRDAVLSIFRIDSCEPGASLEAADLLSDRRYTVQDRAMSSSELDGTHLPLRVFRVGEWFFPAMAGPPLAYLHIGPALARLEEAGMSLDPEGMRAEAHLLGRLWGWLPELVTRRPVLQNTDGDPLEWHTAELHVSDSAAFAAELARRDDVVADEPGAQWTWFREGGPVPGFGETTTLARLELFGDWLVLQVNSVRRLERARAWLEALPGIRFVSSRRADPGDAGEGPLDDRLPGPRPARPSPDVRAALEHHLEQQALRWLDEPVPALGELTPRAACSTAEGRRRVARLIRTMPSVRTNHGEVPPPRELLMRELGL